jgi:hypothetical protein
MAKRLLSVECNKIVEKVFYMPENDFVDYYKNVIDKYIESTPDIFQKLTDAVNYWLNKCRNTIPDKVFFEIDSEGKRKYDSLKKQFDENKVPLHQLAVKQYFETDRCIYKTFFDTQIDIIERQKSQHELNEIDKRHNKLLLRYGTMFDVLAEQGFPLNPTHDFEKLKIHRQNIYEVDEKDYIRNLEINNQEITDYKLKGHYVDWLKKELKVIDQWLSDSFPNGEPKKMPETIVQIEIEKYRNYVNSEIANTMKILNPHPTAEQGKQKASKPQTLIEIWEPDRNGNKAEYQRVIEKLIPDYLTKSGNKLTWNKKQKNIKYLAGFIKTCIEKKWILNNYSSSDYKRILQNTFNITFNAKPFKMNELENLDKKYSQPFKNMPSNL